MMEFGAFGSSVKAEVGKAKIKVIGVGGAGNNTVNRMIESEITTADFIAVNTDAQILACSKAPTTVQIGAKKTKGLGAGAEPDIGKESAEESKEELKRVIENTDLLFITAGMGGGTGTGAAPVIAKLAKDQGILTVAVVTEPFEFEGRKRRENADKGIEALAKYVDTMVLIPNEKINDIIPADASFSDALRVADDVLIQGIRGITDTIMLPSIINLDFADVRTVLQKKGLGHMGVGVARGEDRVLQAIRFAVDSPLLDTTIEGAKYVLVNVVGGNDLSFREAQTAATLVKGVVDYSANIIFGARVDPNITDEVHVTVIATGFPTGDEEEVAPAEPVHIPTTIPYYHEPQAPVAPVVEEEPIVEEEPDVEEVVEEQQPTNTRIPPFLRNLFRKK